MRVGLTLLALVIAQTPLLAAPGDAPRIAPVASLTDGQWLKGDLHLHSRHSQDSTNNPEAKIIKFAEDTGFDYLAITDHDNHVAGDVAHHTWSDPEFKSKSPALIPHNSETRKPPPYNNSKTAWSRAFTKAVSFSAVGASIKDSACVSVKNLGNERGNFGKTKPAAGVD